LSDISSQSFSVLIFTDCSPHDHWRSNSFSTFCTKFWYAPTFSRCSGHFAYLSREARAKIRAFSWRRPPRSCKHAEPVLASLAHFSSPSPHPRNRAISL
jgi:hypothetical protein